MYTFRWEITVQPGKMPEMVEEWQRLIQSVSFPCRLYASVTGRFNVVAVEGDFEHLTDLEFFTSQWPNPAPDQIQQMSRYLDIETQGSGGALWLKLV